MNITPLTFKLLSILGILLGLLIGFFGYRIFRLVLAIAGFIIGSSFVAGIGFTLTNGNESLLILITAIAGGLIVAVILLFLYSAGVFLLGALFGISILSGVLNIMNIGTSTILYIFPAVLGGIMALYFQRFMIILSTSIAGGWIVVISTLYLINSDLNPLASEFLNNITEIEIYRIVLSFMALGAIGFIVQYLIFPQRIERLNEEIRQEEKDSAKKTQ